MTQSAWVLPTILAVPLLGAILVMLLPRNEAGLARGFGFAFSLATFLLSLLVIGYFNFEYGRYQLVLDLEWIPGLNAHFKLGIDGISIWLVLLTTFTMPIALLSAHKAINKKVREFVATVLILEVGMLGTFMALDLFLFYVFWEVMLIPMYLLIGIWGGQRRIYASIKFVIYTMVGSLLMLVAIFYVYAKHGGISGTYTTDLITLQQDLFLSRDAQFWCFAAFGLAFAIKVPLFPLHTWLPDAHVEAPTAGSVILAGVMLKFGIYGFIRFGMPMFPAGSEAWSTTIAILAVVGIVYGAYVAFAQPDVKKLVAYSSVSHLGFCVLGLFALTTMGVEGSIYAMLSHGLTTGGLFLAIGVLYERRHTRRMAEYGGLWKQMPVFAGVFLIVTLGSAGLPGLSGFIGEFLTIFGTFTASDTALPVPRLLAAVAASGVIFGAVYLLYMFQKMMFGPIKREANRNLKDLSGREIAVFVPLVIMIFVMGIYPQPFLKAMEPAVDRFLISYQTKLSNTRDTTYVKGVEQQPKVGDSQPAGAKADSPGANAGSDKTAALREQVQRRLQGQLDQMGNPKQIQNQLRKANEAQRRGPPPGNQPANAAERDAR